MTYQVRENVAGKWQPIGWYDDFLDAQATAVWCHHKAQIREFDSGAWHVCQEWNHIAIASNDYDPLHR